MIQPVWQITQVVRMDGCFQRRGNQVRSFEGVDVFTERVTKSFARVDVFIKRATKSFAWVDVFTEQVTEAFWAGANFFRTAYKWVVQ